MKAIAVFGFFLFIFSTSWSQRSASGLRDKAVQKSIQGVFDKYDSLIFVDKANYRYDDMLVKGFAFRGKKVYFIKITFEKVDTEPYTISILDTEKHKIKGKIVQNLLQKTQFRALKTWDNDSLSIKSKPGTAQITFADGSIYSLLIINNNSNEIILKQCTAPINYQKMYATRERAAFIQLFQFLYKKVEAYY